MVSDSRSSQLLPGCRLDDPTKTPELDAVIKSLCSEGTKNTL